MIFVFDTTVGTKSVLHEMEHVSYDDSVERVAHYYNSDCSVLYYQREQNHSMYLHLRRSNLLKGKTDTVPHIICVQSNI